MSALIMQPHHLATFKQFSTPQACKVLNHMVEYGTITNLEAQSYRIRALPRRISDLEEIIRGFHLPYRLKRTWKRDLEGQRYMEYQIVSTEARTSKAA